MSFTIEQVRHVGNADQQVLRDIRSLLDAAYGEDMTRYLNDIGPGEHLLGRLDGRLLCHLMWVTRWLEPEGLRPLRTGYIELVATAPDARRRGFASALLTRLPSLLADFELAALSPAAHSLYRRLGWQSWRGPLAVRKDGQLIATPDEEVMVLPLPRTPALNLDASLSVEWRPGEVW